MSLTYTVALEVVTCPSCGIPFGMPEWYERDLRNDHRTFYCPNGHGQHFYAKSEAEKERERRIRAEARAARAEDNAEVAERRRRAEKGQRTKVENRIKNGICPWCRRPFDNVAKHMETKHKDIEVGAGA